MNIWKNGMTGLEKTVFQAFPTPGKSLRDILRDAIKEADGKLCFLVFTETEEAYLYTFLRTQLAEYCFFGDTERQAAMNFLHIIVCNEELGILPISVAPVPEDPNKTFGDTKKFNLGFWISHNQR